MQRRDFLTGMSGLVTMPLMLPSAALAAQSARKDHRCRFGPYKNDSR